MKLPELKIEPLDPILADGVYETEHFQMISVPPLLHSMYFGEADNARLNVMYREKLTAYNHAISNREWGTALALSERPYRVDVLEVYRSLIPSAEFAYQLGWVWSDTEAPHQSRDKWDFLWGQYRASVDKDKSVQTKIMDDKEYDVFKHLPNVVKIYRGGHALEGEPGGMRHGLSWTLERQTAEWFASRFDRDGVVHERRVDKSRILAFFSGRGEEEVVVV